MQKNKPKADHAPRIRKARFRFYEELNDHLPEAFKKKAFAHNFRGNPSVKDTIQALGIPHGEVDLILVNGEPVGFDYNLQGGEEIAVYPVFESLDISPLMRLRTEPLRQVKFIVDVNLGKLALKLRLLGFDTLFRNDLVDDEIIEIAQTEHRIILTRDRGILKQNAVSHGLFVRNDNPKKQLTEVISRLQLQNLFRPFSRCSACNGKLEAANRSEIEDEIDADAIRFYNEFWRCISCSKIYWKGSHYDRIEHWIDELRSI